MKIAAFPKCWIPEIVDGTRSLESWIDESVALECDGLELYLEFLTSHEPTYLAGIRARIEGHGMQMPMMCYSPDFTQPDSAARAQEVAKQIEAINVTAALGGHYCRTLSGQNRPEVSEADGVSWTVASIQECLPAAQHAGVKLVLENHFKDGYWQHREFAQKMDVFLKIVERIDSQWFGVQYDPSNALVAGDDPVELLDAVLDRVMTMHASDRFLLPGTEIESLRQADGTLGYPEGLVHGVTGGGSIDYHAIFSRLQARSFAGWISIEDGMNGLQEMKDSVDFLKTMRGRYRLGG